MGLSAGIVDEFLEPFFEAIYVARLRDQSAAMFDFVPANPQPITKKRAGRREEKWVVTR